MSVTLDGVSSLPGSEVVSTAAATNAMGQETFLNLLVTQLQHQDPLDPQSNEEFVAQLAQFSSLEQLVSLNTGVDGLYMATASMNNATMTQLLGRDVVAWSSEFHHQGEGDTDLHFEADTPAASATVTISDEDGNVVWSGEMGALDSGEGTWTWDGTDQDGNLVEAGVYSFDIDAQGANGEEVTVQGQIHGEVDGMSYADGTPIPSISGVEITLGDIVRVETTNESTSEDET